MCQVTQPGQHQGLDAHSTVLCHDTLETQSPKSVTCDFRRVTTKGPETLPQRAVLTQADRALATAGSSLTSCDEQQGPAQRHSQAMWIVIKTFYSASLCPVINKAQFHCEPRTSSRSLRFLGCTGPPVHFHPWLQDTVFVEMQT